jgi:phage tail-like protein
MLQLPSIQLDQVEQDFLSAAPAQVISADGPFELVDGDTLIVTFDGIPATITFVAAAFADIATATVSEVIAAVRPTAESASGQVFASGSAFGLRTSNYGALSVLGIGAGTANAALGLSPDVITGTDAEDVLVANRNPQPGEVQVPLEADVEFDYIRADESPLPANSTFRVWINGVLVWNAAGFQAGRFGLVSNGLPDDGTIRFSIQGNNFTSGQLVTVIVDQGTGDFQETWSFVAYDTQPPLLAAVQAVNKDQVRVTFNEPVMMISSAIEGDALNPDSYFIERVSRPAATPGVVTVHPVSETVVLLTTSFELTFGAQYMLVVTGISDEFGNVFLPPDNVVAFSGWLPPFPPGRQFLLHRFVPAFALGEDVTDDLRLFLGCLQDSTNLLLHLIDKWAEILDPDLAPETFLDQMLEDLGNPFVFDLTVDLKRKLIKVLVRIYQLKGTVPGIIDVVRFFVGVEVTVEVFNGLGWKLGFDKLVAQPNPAIIGAGGRARFAFRVRADVILTDVQREQIATIATYMKGAQEHMVGVLDATAPPLTYRFWKLGFSLLGHAKLAA